MAAAARGWIRRLFVQCWRHPLVATLAAVSSLLVIGLGALGPLIAARVVDDAVVGRTATVGVFVGVLVGLGVMRFVGSSTWHYMADRLAIEVQQDLLRAVHESVQRLDGAGHDKLRSGQVLSRATVDLQVVQRFVAETLGIFGTLVMGVFALTAMAVLSVPLALVALVVVACIAVVTTRAGKVLPPATWSARERAAELTQHVTETVTGASVVKGCGQEPHEVGRFRQLAERLFSEQVRVASVTARPMFLLVTLPGLGRAGLLGLGGWLVMNGHLSLGTFLAVYSYSASLTGPASAVTQLFLSAQSSRAAVERVYELIDAQSTVTEAPDARDLPEGPLAVRLDEVSFGYRRDEPVLDDVSLSIRPGETLAVVGSTGSGKSTISLLLARFYDVHSGSVRVGAPNAEQDVRELTLSSLRNAVGVVFEEPFLFSDTVRANIAYGYPDATDAEVAAAAGAAAVHDFISTLPRGYDTVVGERGATLSGGQRQRIALARVLLTRPRVLVLDDATSAVDNATETVIHSALDQLTQGRTTILVAHRRSSLALADRIAVLDEGQVVDVGTHQELAARCPLFNALLAGGTEDIDREPAAGTDLWPAPPEPAETHPWSAETLRALPPADRRPRLPTGLDPTAPDPQPRIRTLVGPVWRTLSVAAVLVACTALAAVALPTLLRYGVDDGVVAETPWVLWTASGLVVLVASVNGMCAAVQKVLTTRVGETASYLLRVRVFAHLQRLGMDFYESQRNGQIVTRMTTDVDAVSTFLTTGLTTTVVSTLTLAGVTVTVLVTDPSLALVAFSVLPPLIAATAVFRRMSSRAYTDARERVGEVNADLHESVSATRVTQAHAGERRSARRFSATMDAYRRSSLRAQRYLAVYFPFIGLLADVAYAVVLGVGAFRVVGDGLTVGALMAFLLYLGLLFSPIQQLSDAFDGYQRATVAMRQTRQLMGTRAAVTGPASPVPVPQPLTGAIEMRNVTFRYPGSDEPAVRDITLHIAPGETVALVGATGAGKSTVAKLLARFYDPTEGEVLVDGIDVRRFAPSSYRARLGIVAQEPHLFCGDVAGNIGYSRPDAGPTAIERAARQVDALSMIASLPYGFRQPVGERGRGLSAGQRQLVALARAYLAEPDIMLLDEATAALDPVTEFAVLTAESRLTRRRTTVVVAHRLATAARADRIVVLADGRVVECGSHDELLGAGGHYARLWTAGSMDAA